MEMNVKNRLSAQEALKHPWLNQFKYYKLDAKTAQAAIGNLSNFQNESKLKQAVLTFISGHMTTKRQQHELKKSFLQFDTNGDGLIQRNEFVVAYNTLYPD